MQHLSVRLLGIESRKSHLLPDAPDNLTAINETDTTVELNWDAVSHAVGYKIHQDGSEIDTSESNSYEVTGLTAETDYEFYVIAYNVTDSEPSNTITVTTDKENEEGE